MTMRIRALVLVASLVPSAALVAQRLPRRRIGGPGTLGPQPRRSPEAPGIARTLSYERSRWSSETYSTVNSFAMPTGAGMVRYTMAGAGTHASYRYSDHFSGTIDMTSALLGSPGNTESVELGSRYTPFPWEQRLRPFFDLRGGFLRMTNTINAGPALATDLGQPGEFEAATQGSRGLGGVTGAGLEFSLTRMFALETELSMMRSRMTTYDISNPSSIPLSGPAYWMTSYRFVLGFRFSPVRSRSAAVQKVMP
jgi:hypothetical protein